MIGNMKVGYKLGIIPLVYTLILVGLLLYVVDSCRALLDDAVVQDVSGRQRMLNEKYLKEVFLAMNGADGQRRQTASAFMEAQRGLISGGQVTVNLNTRETAEVPPADDPVVIDLLNEQGRLFEKLVQASNSYLALEVRDQASLDRLLELSDEVFENSNAITSRLAASSQSSVSELIASSIALVVFTTLLGLALSALVARQITEPLRRVAAAMLKVADGDLREESWESDAERKDELGQLFGSVATMKSSLRTLIKETVQATNSLTAAASQVAASSQQQAAATAEQMSAVQETTATMEELGQTGHQVSTRAREVGAAAEDTSTASISGVEAVKSTFKIMEQIREQVQVTAENIVALSEKNRAVRDVIATVNDIAERTNLLALNAAIEAAAAGESGARFSVVAEELKSLADQAKSATGEVRSIMVDIEERIHRSVRFTEEAVKRVERGRHEAGNAEQTIKELNNSTADSVRAFQQIVASASQQQIGFEQVVQALQSIREASEQAAQGTQQLDEASSSLAALVEQLLERTSQFTTS